MAKKKQPVIPIKRIIEKTPGYFQVLIKDTSGNIKFYNKKLLKKDYLKLYFKNIDDNLKNHPDWTKEEIISKYKNIWSSFQILSDYVDSYGHKWKNTHLSDKACLEFITNKLNEINKK